MEDQIPAQVSTATAAGGIGATAAGTAFVMKYGGPFFRWFLKFFKRQIKESLESGDSSETVETKTPFKVQSEMREMQNLLIQLIDEVRILSRGIHNLNTRFDSMNFKPWDGKERRNEP